MSVDQGTAEQSQPISAPKPPTVVFQGKGRVIIFKNSQFKDEKAFIDQIARVSEPMKVYIEDWTINGLADWSYKIIERVIKILHFFERMNLPYNYTAFFDSMPFLITRWKVSPPFFVTPWGAFTVVRKYSDSSGE